MIIVHMKNSIYKLTKSQVPAFEFKGTSMIDINSIIDRFNNDFSYNKAMDSLNSVNIAHGTSHDELAGFVMREQIVSFQVLKFANDMRPGKVSSISSAINMLGSNLIVEKFNTDRKAAEHKACYLNAFERLNYQKQSLFCAKATKALTKIIDKSGKLNHETAFLIGLLSTIGNILILSFHPEMHYSKHFVPHKYPWDIQKNITSVDQYEVAAELLSSWNIPKEITLPIKHLSQARNIDASPYIKQLFVGTLMSLTFVYAEHFNLENILDESIAKLIGIPLLDLQHIYKDCAKLTVDHLSKQIPTSF